MRKRSTDKNCPRKPGHQLEQMFTFVGNKFDMLQFFDFKLSMEN